MTVRQVSGSHYQVFLFLSNFIKCKFGKLIISQNFTYTGSIFKVHFCNLLSIVALEKARGRIIITYANIYEQFPPLTVLLNSCPPPFPLPELSSLSPNVAIKNTNILLNHRFQSSLTSSAPSNLFSLKTSISFISIQEKYSKTSQILVLSI